MTKIHNQKKTSLFLTSYRAIAMVPIHLHAKGSHRDGHGHGIKKSIGERGKSSDATRTIEINMFDNYYQPQESSVKF